MPANLEGHHILVVDDDHDILTSVRIAFEHSGAKVTTVNDGAKGLDAAKRLSPDLIILDMMMPRKSGFVVIEALKPNPEPGTKPHIIMITANEGKRHEAYARHLGVDEYVNKPFATERLIEVAAKLFGCEYTDPDRR
jgi:DNA-binding response OmpR family regulator